MEQFEQFDMADWYDITYHKIHKQYKQGKDKKNDKKNDKKSDKLSSKNNLELSIKHGIIKCQRTIERKEKEIADDRLYYCSNCKKIDIQVCRCMYLEWCGSNEDSDYCIYNDIFPDRSCMYHYNFNKDLKKELISKLEIDYKGKKHIYKKYLPVQRNELEIIH
jgi:hypothetical protein